MGAQNYYLELQNHGMSEEEDVNRFLLQLSDELKIPMVATNDVHYATKEDARAQRVLMCIQTNTTIQDDTAPIGFTTEEYYYKSTEEMAQLFVDCPQALTNTVDIARRCQFDFTFGTFLLPTYPTPDGIDADTYLRDLAQKGFEKRQAAGELDFSRNDLHAYQTRMNTRSSVLQDGICAILFDCVGFYPLRTTTRHSRGTGTRIGRGVTGGLFAGNHTGGQHEIRADV